jgi:hypothetical protein
MRAEQVGDPAASHGEGPVWSPGWGGLRWVDMLAGDVLSRVALGHLPSVDEAAALVRVHEVVHPDPDTADLHRRLLPSFAATAEVVATLHAWRQYPAPADRSRTGGNAEEL